MSDLVHKTRVEGFLSRIANALERIAESVERNVAVYAHIDNLDNDDHMEDEEPGEDPDRLYDSKHNGDFDDESEENI